MRRHEAGCTNNPDRVCGLCAHVHLDQKPIAELIAALGDGTSVEALRDAAECCPTCMLAAIRQSGLQRAWGTNGDDDEGFHVQFDYRAELKSWWNCTNDAEADHHNYESYYG